MKNSKTLPEICIVGRPNVGKSSLFNAILGRRKAVVVGESGTTRDKGEAVAEIGETNVKLIDTGGYAGGFKDDISVQVRKQVERAMGESSLILMVTDIKDGVTSCDESVAELLRKFDKTVILVVNKADNEKIEGDAIDFYKLGLGDPEIVSCLHRRGIKGLEKRIEKNIAGLAKMEYDYSEKDFCKIAVVGRPNVGKSSYVNYLLARDRVIVSDTPGTTRDSIDTEFYYEDEKYLLIDTAGIRHKRKIKNAVDVYSIMRSKESIKRADVVVLLVDAADGFTKDDMGILDFVVENGKACLLLVNKWDLAEENNVCSADEYKKHMLYASARLSKFPISFISSKTGRNVLKSLATIKELNAQLDIKVPTPFLNKIFERNDPSRVPVSRKKKRPNFLYVVQSRRRPVEFKFFVNDPTSVLPAHISFIDNQLRSNLPLSGVPVRVVIEKARKEKR